MNQSKIFILTILLFCIGCQRTDRMNEAKFTQIYLNALQQKNPDVSYNITGFLEIEAEKEGQTFTHFLNNAFNSYSQEPSDLNNIIETYSNSASELYEQDEKLDTTRIVPIIKDVQYLEEVKKLTKSEEINLVYQELNKELVVLFAEDTEKSISYFTKDKLNKTSFDGDLYMLATKNLDNILPDIEILGEKPLFMLNVGGDYEASLILLDFIWTKENFPVDGEIVILIPSRDLLMITGSESIEGLKKMKKLANEVIESGNYTLTSDFFIRSNGAWKMFEFN